MGVDGFHRTGAPSRCTTNQERLDPMNVLHCSSVAYSDRSRCLQTAVI